MRKFLIALSLTFAVQADILNRNSIIHPAVGDSGMVVTQHYLATEVGQAILKKGGNAVDASVAVAFALAVVLPRACLLYTSPSPRDRTRSRMPSSA